MDISKGSVVAIVLVAIVGGYLIASIIVLLQPNLVYPKRRFSSKTRKDGRVTTKNKKTENTRGETQPLLDDTYRQDVRADVHIPPVAPSAETGKLDVDKRPQTKDIHLRKRTVAIRDDDEVFTFRHQYLLFECGTNILRRVYDITVGDKFSEFFKKKPLKDLVKKYPLTEKQEKILLPDGEKASSPSSSDFDFDILCCLLNNLTDRGRVSNLVVVKNVKLLKLYKNMLMQRGSVYESRDDTEFRKLMVEDSVLGSSGNNDTKWIMLCKILNRFVYKFPEIQQQWIGEASTVEMDDYLKRQYTEMVRSWSEMDRVLECGVGEFQSKVDQCKEGQKQLNLITSMVDTALCTDSKADIREERERLLVSSDEVTEKPLDAKRYTWELEDPVVDVVKTAGVVLDTGGELDREIITVLSVIDQCMKDQDLLEEKMTTMVETDTVKPSQPMDETCPQPDIVYIFRYQYLLLEVGTKILCAVFDKRVDSDFKQYLANHPKAEHQLNFLIRRRVITTKQAMLIPPEEKNPTSVKFDLTLLYCLLRHVCGLKHYSDTVWINPDETDDSIEACITRLRCCRNELMHSSIMFDSESDFTVKWNELCMILRKLDEFGGNVNTQLIDDAHGKSFTDSVKMDNDQTLTTWLEIDRIGEYGVGELVSMMNLYVDGQERVYRKISQLLATVDKQTELVPSFKVRYRNRSMESGQHHGSTRSLQSEPSSYDGPKSVFTFRYQYLLIEVGTKILRAVFDLLVGDNFEGYLDKNKDAKKQLKKLMDENIIPKEKHGLFVKKPASSNFDLKKPASSNFDLKKPASSNFDLSLLCSLLRHVCGLKHHSDDVWKNPADDDYSTEACITRLKNCRNALVHRCTVYESETELQDKWNQLVKILTPLRDYSGMKETIEELVNQAETIAIDVKQKKRVSEELRKRQEKDEMFQHRLREVISKLDQCIKSQERLEVMVTHWIKTRINSQRQAEGGTIEDDIDDDTEFERLVMEGHCVVECTVGIVDDSVVVVNQTGENVEFSEVVKFEDVMKSLIHPTILNIRAECVEHLKEIVECVQDYDKMEYVIWGSSREIRRQITELDDEIRIFKRPTLKLYAYYFTCFLPFVYFDNLVLLISHSFSTEDTSRLSQLRQWLSNKFLLSLSPMVNHLKKRGIRTYLVHTDGDKANNESYPSSVALQIKQISALPAHCQRDPSPTNSQLAEDYNINRPESSPQRVASPSSSESLSEYFESNETAVTYVSSETSESVRMTAGQTVLSPLSDADEIFIEATDESGNLPDFGQILNKTR